MDQNEVLYSLHPTFPDEGSKIKVAYIGNDRNLHFKELIYDGRLTFDPDMKSAIWWKYIK